MTVNVKRLALALSKNDLVMPKQVMKRDGAIVTFDLSRIERAVTRCYQSLAEEEIDTPQTSVDQIATSVATSMASRFGKQVPTVEQVQDLVEVALLSAGEITAARHYISYRNEHAKGRVIVPAEVKASFDADKAYFPNPLQQFQFFDKYSRFNWDLMRRETWNETVDRSVDHLRWLVEEFAQSLPESTFDRIRTSILNHQTMPSMRLLAMAGEPARRNGLALFNCSYLPVDCIEAFGEALFISMSGCGVGYSVERQYVEKFPRIQRQTGETQTHWVEDTTEGWMAAVYLGVSEWFAGRDVEFVYDFIRPEGSPLKIKGGRASGPDPLRFALNFMRDTILRRQGSFLRTTDAHGMMCAVGQAAVSGGVRRTAMIALFSWDDVEMRECKNGPWGSWPQVYENANNSAVWPDDLTQVDVMDQMLSMVKGERGEPGIFSRANAARTAPARRKTTYPDGTPIPFGTNPCLTGDTLVAVADGRGQVAIRDLAEKGDDVPVFSLDDGGSMVVRWMRAPRLTGHKEAVYRVMLDDGSSVRATGNHKFLTKESGYVAVSDLVPGSRLHVMTKFLASFPEVIGPKSTSSRSQDYWWVNNGRAANRLEHRYVAEFHYGVDVKGDETVHHIDFNAQNNDPSNLRILTKVDHDSLHAEGMMGDLNPMRRAQTEWSDEKWASYRAKQSKQSTGEANKRYSGNTHDDLRDAALALTSQLCRRVSVLEWQEYAGQHGLPMSFSGWRKTHLGGMMGFLTWAALECGFESSEADPRTQRRLLDFSRQGYDCFILNGGVVFRKVCELCETEFTTERRETAVCGQTCAQRRRFASAGSRSALSAQVALGWESKHVGVREEQAKIFNLTKATLGREPLKKEWVSACRSEGVSFEVSRQTSPFTSWADLKDYASNANHVVVGVEFDGYEDVYNGTVDDFHNFFVGGFETITRSGKRKVQFVNNLQCGEINLRPMGLCNLSIAVARESDTESDLMDKVEIATIIGTIQSLSTHFPSMRSEWTKNAIEERLLGVDLLGQRDCILLRENNEEGAALRRRLKEHAIRVNEVTAKVLGINPSASITCDKPAGNSSLFLDTASGIHSRWAPFGIRRTRVSTTSAQYRILKDAGVPLTPENGQTAESATTWVAAWPVRAPEGARTRKDFTAIEQCDYWLLNKLNWTEHNPSVTITYQKHEILDIINWVWQHRDLIGGMSFLPADDAQYSQAPNEEITEEEYVKLLSNFPKDIDWSKLYAYEHSDMTAAAQEMACLAGVCET